MSKVKTVWAASLWLAAGCCPVGVRDRARSASRLVDGGFLHRTHVVLLGSGTPNTDPERHGPALAVVVRGQPYVVDCGPGIVRRASAAFRHGVTGLMVSRLDRLFLTHLHSDHTAGFPDLWLTPWVVGREKPLHVIGPPGTRAFVSNIQAAYRNDIKVRLSGLEPANATGHRLQAKEVTKGTVYRDGIITVHAFAARHGAFMHAFGYRFVTPDLDVCISGDTAPYPAMTRNYARCDVLVHEVFSVRGLKRRPPQWRAYHTNNHTSSAALSSVARRVRPGLLVLNHQLQWGTTADQLVKEVKSGYDGPVLYGRDLMFIGVTRGFRGYRRGGPTRAGFRAGVLGTPLRAP